MSEKKFREFELFYSGMSGSLAVWPEKSYNEMLKNKNDFDEYIHVIEYSAYEQAQKEIELLRKVVQLQREGLEEINIGKSKDGITYGMYQAHQIARQTLKQVDELLKGESC
jgi:hypothetical protein